MYFFIGQSCNIADNQIKTTKTSGVKVVLNVMNTQIDNLDTSFSFFWIISFGNAKLQKEVCEKGVFAALFRVLLKKKHCANTFF